MLGDIVEFYDSIKSYNAEIKLFPYYGGFMYLEDKKHQALWAKLLRIDKEKGMLVEAFRFDSEKVWYRDTTNKGIPFEVEGIKKNSKEGSFEMYGDLSCRSGQVLVHTYIPERYSSEIFMHFFYVPFSDIVPKDILASYNE